MRRPAPLSQEACSRPEGVDAVFLTYSITTAAESCTVLPSQGRAGRLPALQNLFFLIYFRAKEVSWGTV